MPFTLPELPFANNALEPHMSAETLEYHHGKHLNTYVTTLNKLIDGTEWEGKSLEEIIRGAKGGTFNISAQVWNHTFFFNCMSPQGGGNPTGLLADELTSTFGSIDAFKEAFTKAAATHFGSGWAWLVKDASGKLSIETTSNAGCPLTDGKTPLFTCDVWEHAYYIDYRNARPKYIEAFWNLANWDFVAKNLEHATSGSAQS